MTASLRAMKAGLLAAVMLTAVQPSLAQDASPAVPAVLADGHDAQFRRVDDMHKVRYIEIFLAAREAGTGKIVAACYNPMYTAGGIPASRDTAPQALVAGLDFETMKREYGVLGASLNGPKIWLPDWSEADVGVERDFNGIRAVWVAQLDLGDKTGVGAGTTTPYAPMTIARKSAVGWNKGTTAILLDDVDGNTWIMKGFQLGLEPQYTYEEFRDAAETKLKALPKGWKVRVKKLEQDLIERPEGGVATIMGDEFFNIYDKTGPGMTNYRP